MPKALPLSVLLAAVGAVGGVAVAEDAAPAPAPVPAPAPAWVNDGKIGVFVTSISNHNSAFSNDPAIASTRESLAYQIQFEDRLGYRTGRHSVDQIFQVKYGRERQEGEDWVENTDSVEYDGVYGYTLRAPHFLYVSWGADTVITEPDPGDDVLEPGVAKVATGYGQRYENLLPEKDRLEARLGVRAQKRWGGEPLTGDEREWQVGPEFFARYERKQATNLFYWIQFEAFSEFEDLGHITNLATAGLDLKLNKWLAVNLGARAYYETEPDDAEPGTGERYDSWSWRTEALIGLSYQF